MFYFMYINILKFEYLKSKKEISRYRRYKDPVMPFTNHLQVTK